MLRKLKEMWQVLLRNKILFAVLNIVLGIYMIIARRGALNTVIRVVGYALLVTAIAYLVMYFTAKRTHTPYQQDRTQLYYAGTAGIAGLAMLWLAPSLVSFFPVLAGLALIAMGIVNLTSASAGDSFPAYSKAGPIITIIIGAIVLFNPGAVINLAVALAGVALILNGLTELDLIRRIW